MKRKIVSVIILLMLIAQMILPSIANATNEGENKTSTDTTNTQNTVSTDEGDMEIGGNGSFGTLLADSINEQDSENDENKFAGITNAEIDSNIAKITYFSYEQATVIVAIYNEEKNKIITSSKKNVDIAKEETEIEIELEGEIPQYFVLKAFMIDKDNNPLCDVYENSTYTQEMQKLLAMTTDDFEPDRVLNIDDKKETNFAIYNEDTVIVKAQESGVTLKSADEEKQIYVFENINDKIRNLKKDDIFSYVIDEEQEIIVKVSKITISGNTATITGGELEIDEVFDYVKIETDMSDADIKVTESDDDAIRFDGIVNENSDSDYPMFGAEVGGDYAAEFAFTIKEYSTDGKDENDEDNEDNEEENDTISASAKFTGRVLIKFNVNFKLYMTTAEKYLELGYQATVTAEGEISGKFAVTIPMLNGVEVNLPKKSKSDANRISLKYIPKIKFEFSASVKFSSSVTVGEIYRVTADGVEKNSLPADTEYDFGDAELKAFIGLVWDPEFQIKLFNKKIGKLGLEIKSGIQATAELDKDTSESVHHDCNFCLDGKIELVNERSFEVSLLKIISVKFSNNKHFEFAKFYVSISHGEIGLGTCPYKSYKVTLDVVDENDNIVDGAEIEINGVDLENNVTDGEGKLAVFLKNGTYQAITRYNDKVSIQTIKVKNQAREIKVKLSQTLDIDGAKVLKEGQCGDDAYFVLYSNGILYIYGEGELWNGSGSLEHIWYWENNTTSVKKLIIDEGITAIGESTFAGEPIEDIILPSSLKKIGYDSFRKCDGLKSVIIPDSVEIIGGGAFEECANLEYVTMSKNIKEIGGYAFYCTGLKSIIIPESCQEIGQKAFYGCENLDYVSIASKIIGEEAFGWTHIKELYIQEGVQEIRDCAFNDWYGAHGGSIINASLPNSLEYVGNYAFLACRFGFNDNDNVNLVIPSKVKHIGDWAFKGCYFGNDNLKSQLTIPETVKSIGDESFYGIHVPNITIGCKKSGEKAFEEGYFKNVHILGTAESTGDFTRAHIENLIIDNGVKYTGSFYNVEALKEVDFPKSIEEIGGFGYCLDLETVRIRNGMIGREAFCECMNLTNLTMDEGVTYIGDYAFFRCRALHAPFYIPSTVKYIGSNCFGDTDSYGDVILKGEMPEFGKNGDYFAFGGYGNKWNDIKRVFYPNTWKELPEYVIYDPDVKTLWIPYDENNIEGLNKMLEENGDENEAPEDSEEPDENEKIENNSEIQDNENNESNENNEENIESSEQISKISFNAKVNNFLSKYEGTSQNIENSEEKTSKFTGLVANENYIIYVLKEENTYDMLEKNNLLYIDQGKADENGEISFTYIPKEETENAIVLLYGKENPEKIEEKTYLTGDVNGDGKVSLLDYGLVLAHVKRKKLLTGGDLERADVNKDNKVSLLDYGLILAHVKRTKLLF